MAAQIRTSALALVAASLALAQAFGLGLTDAQLAAVAAEAAAVYGVIDVAVRFFGGSKKV